MMARCECQSDKTERMRRVVERVRRGLVTGNVGICARMGI